jgi:hypothetical protein
VRAGIVAGIATVGVLTGAGTEAQLRAAGAREVLRSLAELPDFLDRIDSGNGSSSCDTPPSGRRSTRS